MLIIEGSQEGEVDGVRVLNHCVFCLTKLSSAQQSEQVEPGTVRKYTRWASHCEVVGEKKTTKATRFLTDFPTTELNVVWREVVQRSNGALLTFPKMPPICRRCGTMLKKIHDALKELDVFVNTFITTMKCSGKDGSKAEEKFYTFVRELKDAKVEDGSRRATLNFLEKVGHGEMTEEEYLHYFSKGSQDVAGFISEPTKPKQVSTESLKVSSECFEHPGDDVEIKMEVPLPEDEEETTAPEIVHLSSKRTATKLETAHICEVNSSAFEYPKHGTQPIQSLHESHHFGMEIKEEVPFSPEPTETPHQVQAPLGEPPEKDARQMTHISCDLCNTKIKTKLLHDHVHSHVGDYLLSCPDPECPFACAGLPRFKRHLEDRRTCSPPPSKDLCICSVCGSKRATLKLLQTHLTLNHERGSKNFPCPLPDCLSKFSNRQSVQLHISYLHAAKSGKFRFQPPPSFQNCPGCAKNIHQDRIRAHLETIHKIPMETQVPCKYCPYVFSNHDQLLDHLQVHTAAKIPLACHKCPSEQRYLYVSKLRQHYHKEHQIGTTFICEHCPGEFYSIKSLQFHVKFTHAGLKKSAKAVECEDCKDGVLYTETRLVSHRITHHGAEPLNCQYCEETFTTKAKQRLHENKHRGVVQQIKKHVCDIPGCGKTYNSPKKLKRHQLGVEHLGRTEAFICPECGKGYNTEECLKGHRKKTHSSERKYVCEDCGESFCRSQVLKRHKLIHTGERPFECPQCEQRFRFKQVLTRHIEAHKRKGADFKPNGPMAKVRKRVNPK